MIRKIAGALCCTVSLVGACAIPASAQFLMKASFIVPETLDPNESLTFVNLLPNSIGADDLLAPSGYPTVKALEIHSGILGSRGGILDVDLFQVSFLFDGTLAIDSSGSPPFTVPWTVSDTVVGQRHTLRFDRLHGSVNQTAPINDNLDPGPGDPFHKSFASLTFLPADAQSAQDFLDSNPGQSVMVTALTTGLERTAGVPEPGPSTFVAVSVSLVGALGLRRRRRRTARNGS